MLKSSRIFNTIVEEYTIDNAMRQSRFARLQLSVTPDPKYGIMCLTICEDKSVLSKLSNFDYMVERQCLIINTNKIPDECDVLHVEYAMLELPF